MELKRLLNECFHDSFFRTVFIIAAILGFLLMYMSLAEQINLLGQEIGATIYRWFH